MSLHRSLGTAVFLAITFAAFSPPLTAGPQNPRRTPVVEVVERVRAAVVNIHSERTVHSSAAGEAYSASPNRVNGMGTGIIIDPRGYIITNQHVVDDVSVIRVRLSDGTTSAARVLARDQESDLALIKIDVNRSLPTMPIGTAKDLMVGETVIAIGNAYGYEHSVTVGVVSAVKRDVTLNKEVSYKALIQTDASINPGNSGGPLLNINGELIGVNVAIRAGAQGIGFAIPVDNMLRVAGEMLGGERRMAAWHGALCRDYVGEPETMLTPAKMQLAGISRKIPVPEPGAVLSGGLTRWLKVERVESDSPAARAGLQSGDVVIMAGNLRIRSGLDLERSLLDRRPDEIVPLLVSRQGEERSLKLTLQAREKPVAITAGELIRTRLGLRLQAADPGAVTRSNRQLRGGLEILEVAAESAAARAGVQKGDILVGLHQWETISLDNVAYVLNHQDLQTFAPLRFFIVRGGQIHRGQFHLADQ